MQMDISALVPIAACFARTSDVEENRSQTWCADKEGQIRHDPIRAAGKRGYRHSKLHADLGVLRVEVSAEQWDISAERWDNRLAVPNTCLLCTLDFLHAR